MPGRFEYERAIRRSGLPPLARLLALTIATWADLDTGVIPLEHQPAQSVLLEATGLSKSAFLNHRTTLVKEGWISFESPSPDRARREHAQNVYSIHIPARSPDDPASLKARSPRDPAKKGKTPQKVTEARSPDDPASKGARSPDDLELGRQTTQRLGRQATTRVPTSPSSPATTTPTAQTIVGEWIGRAPKRPPSAVVGQVARIVAELLAEDLDPDDIRRGMARWMQRGLHPSTLPSVVNEVMNAAPPPTARRAHYTDPAERGIF
ncbi:hypothetical protein AQ490_23315 [Wenjunlia vitaminophila]|uniref:Helix-turn-helix domain-containing protein n=1 Tax=Wenjunlia vitaminophila TaxID=76728 RepID=A0A0T6LSC1_WENVI|nr:hypothetical protein [Wenjunlia vitaminophila]KRV48801.1 hypothetical protein AQ490_23315 [Wenjunlia vitaminophila]